jgi:tetratricopeptide (TPR) repeat protein
MATPTTPPAEDLLSHTLAFCDDCLNREDYTAAWQALCRAVNLAPNRADLLSHRGRLALFLKDTESARGDFAAALKIDPRCSAAWSGQARYYMQQGEAEEAEAAADRALGIDPVDEEAAQLNPEIQAERCKVQSPSISSMSSQANSAESEGCAASGKPKRDFTDGGFWTPQTSMLQTIREWFNKNALPPARIALSIGNNPMLDEILMGTWHGLQIERAIHPQHDAQRLTSFSSDQFDVVYS